MASSIVGSARIGGGGSYRAAKQEEGGFSLIEVLMSMAVLTVGMVSLLGVFGLAMATTQTSQQNLIAKEIADESLESIITARNTSQVSWAQIWNAASCTGAADPTGSGIFLSGMTPIYNSGADGIFGTCDDTATGVGLESLTEPGPDGIYNTSDDTVLPLTNYQRTILIYALKDANGNVIASLRGVTVTIQYATAQNPQAMYVLNTYISQYP